MENIFKNAKLGDKFVNRAGIVFIFQKVTETGYAHLFSSHCTWACPLDGRIKKEGLDELDIIGKYEEQ